MGLQHPEGVDAPPRAAPPRWWPQVQPVEEGALEDALEVEEEAHPPPPTQAQEDAPALQVNAPTRPTMPCAIMAAGRLLAARASRNDGCRRCRSLLGYAAATCALYKYSRCRADVLCVYDSGAM